MKFLNFDQPSGVNMAPNFSARRTPPNVQKIPAGEGIYIQTKHKQTTLRSSRDQQNFPQLQSSDVPVPLKVTSPIPQILSPNLVSKHRCKFSYNHLIRNLEINQIFLKKWFLTFNRENLIFFRKSSIFSK